MFENIVVAVDRSTHAMHAIETACKLAKTYNSKLHLLHAPQIPPDAMAVGAGAFVSYPTPEMVQETGADTMEAAVAKSKECGITPTTTRISPGSAAEDTIALADEMKADLIVVGRRGRGGFGSLMMGSTSLKIGHLAPCAVLTVK
ncbi:universal stress protein [Loktanella sp. SALINAS62]|uniref:universal stress protein n=1 Tax=Loktanella sp. SALINAS62 TaxID=2706124 RepID=UPI001B8BECD1|nr:universal stress protein [Loktanella sp. SALINAS62]MBS1302784.1 universal stress protein [Loktanella sp. SALINAS62]